MCGLTRRAIRPACRAKDMYYDGRPIVADAVFDELELRLRQMRSSVVRKYPRCSLHRSGPMYADADEDP